MHSPTADHLRTRPNCFIPGNLISFYSIHPMRLPITTTRASPRWDAVVISQLEGFISFCDLCGDENWLSADGQARAGYRDAIVGFDMRSLFIDVPVWSQAHRDGLLFRLQCQMNPVGPTL